MKFRHKAITLVARAFTFLLLFSGTNVDMALADNSTIGSGNTAQGGTNDSNPGTAWDIRKNYFLRFPVAQEFGPYESGGTDVIKDKVSQGTATGGAPTIIHSLPGCPVYVWPIYVPFAASTVPTYRDMAIDEDLFQTFGYPVSDTQFQIIQRYNDNRMLEEMFDPERIMWLTTSVSGMQATSAANGAANMTTNQSQSAIDFNKTYLTNFTAEAGNRWQAIRDKLFIPIAVLLLLPGAILAQVKSIVSQSSPVLGDTNPFEGIVRSIIAIFLIPGTFLVINYGIDVSNSITFTIADEYTRIFGTDMYVDAQCAESRAFPINAPQSNTNSMSGEDLSTTASNDSSGWAAYEALNLDVRQYDPCAGLDASKTPDEQVRDAKKIARLLTNSTNCGLTLMWNTLCAFQMAFLYYLWCMGPIAAALWVWPMSKLRGALSSWVEGVITLCFWTLFWHTCILLLACFRGVSDTGTVIVTALHYLATISVKYAFDFSGLVSNGGSGGVAQTLNQKASQAGGAMAHAARGGAGGHASAAGAHGPGAGAAGARPGGSTATAGHAAPGGTLASANRSGSSMTVGGAAGAAHGVGVGALGIGGSAGASGGSSGSGPATLGAHPPGASPGGAPGGNPIMGTHDAGMPPNSSAGASANGVLPSGAGALSGLPNTGHNGQSAAQFMASANTAGGAAAFTQSHNSTELNAIAANHLGSGGAGAGANGAANGQGTPQFHTPQTNVGPDGKVHLDQASLGGVNGNPMDPNSQAHQQLSQQLQALSSGDPNALHAAGANPGQAMDPNTKAAFDHMAQNGQPMSAADQAAVNDFAAGKGGITMGADGALINSNTHEPISVGQGGLPPEGLHLGGANTGVAMEANQVFSSPLGGAAGAMAGEAGHAMSAQEMQSMAGGQGAANSSMDLAKMASEHPGQAMGAISAQEIGSAQSGQGLMGLAASEGVSNPQLQTHNGQMDLVGANGQQLAHFNGQSQQWEAAGTNGAVVMGANGQWESANTHSAMAYEGGHWSQASHQAGAAGSIAAESGGASAQSLNASGQVGGGEGAQQTLGSIGNSELYRGEAGGSAGGSGFTPLSEVGGAQGHNAGSAINFADTAGGAPVHNPGFSQFTEGAAGQAGGMTFHAAAGSEPINNYSSVAGSGAGSMEQIMHNNSAVHANHGETFTLASANGTSGGGIGGGASESYGAGGSSFGAAGEHRGDNLPGAHFMGSYSDGSAGGAAYSAGQPVTEGVRQSMDSLARAEGHSGATSIHQTDSGYSVTAADGHAVANYDNSTHQWSAAGTSGNVVMDSQSGQWVNQSSHSAVSFESSSQQWTSAASSQSPLSEASQTSISNIAHQEGYNNVSYNATSSGYQAQAENGAVIANYDSTTHQWSTPQGGVIEPSYSGGMAGSSGYSSPITENVQHSLNSLAQSEGAGRVSYESTSSGIVAQADNGAVIANYDNQTHQWTSSQGGGAVMDSGSGQWTSQTTHSPVSFDNSQQQWTSSSAMSYNAGDSNVSYTPVNDNVRQGLETLARSEGASGPVSIESSSQGMFAQSGGQTIAQYDNSSQSWVATPNGSAGSGVVYDQSSSNWVAQGTHTPVSYDSSNHTWSVAGTNEAVTYSNGQFQAGGFSAPAASVNESTISQAMHGHPEALAQAATHYNAGDVNNYASSAPVPGNVDNSAMAQQQQPQGSQSYAPEPQTLGSFLAGNGGTPLSVPTIDSGNGTWGQAATQPVENWSNQSYAAQNTQYLDQSSAAQPAPQQIAPGQQPVSFQYQDPTLQTFNQTNQVADAQVFTPQPSYQPDGQAQSSSSQQYADQSYQPAYQQQQQDPVQQIAYNFEQSGVAPPESTASTGYSSGGMESQQMHVAPPEASINHESAHNNIAPAIAGAAAGMAVSRASTPHPEAAPPAAHGGGSSAFGKILSGALPKSPQPPQQAPQSSSGEGKSEPEAPPEKKVAEGGLGTTFLAKANRKKKGNLLNEMRPPGEEEDA